MAKKLLALKKENKVMSLEDGDWDFYYTYDCGKAQFQLGKRGFDPFNLPSDAVCNYPSLLFLVLIVGICRVTRSTAMVLTECRYFFVFFRRWRFCAETALLNKYL